MAIDRIFAHISCAHLEKSVEWYSRLYGRLPDARPMQHLAEWRQGDSGGMQLFEDAAHAGHSTLTLMVSDLPKQHQRLESSTLHPGPLESGDSVSLIRMRDPDGNLVVLAQPGRAG